MVFQDPALSLMGFIMLPPALFFLRQLIRRVRSISRIQFTGGSAASRPCRKRAGHGSVKAFGLEDEMRRRLAKSVSVVEREPTRWRARPTARAR